MKNNIVTYADLTCPSVQLKCILKDLFHDLLAKELLAYPSHPVTYTIATKPTSGIDGQIIYISDLSGGTLQFWQESEGEWVNV